MEKAGEFNNILDDCLERLLFKGETIERCLQSYPEYAADIEPLLQTAMATKQALAIQPHPEFKTRARYQFHSALQQVKPRRAWLFRGWQPQWAMVVAIILIFLLAGSGTVAAANGSMPDEALYPVKLATEQVWLALTPSTIGKAELNVNLADRRMVEIARMVNKNRTEHLERVTNRLNRHLVRMAALAEARTREEKVALAPARVPSPSYEAGGDNRVHVRNGRLARFRRTVAWYAVRHPEALQAMLRTAPESAKPSLRRALAIAKARYQQVLEAVEAEGSD